MEKLSFLLKGRGQGLSVLQRLALLLIMLSSFAISKAQNVTISPNSGKLVAGYTYDNEVGFNHGWSSLWRHNQLPLTLTVSDKTDLVEGGQLKDPAGNISLDQNQGRYVLMGGTTVTTSMNISLPKGFRFTGYRIVLLNNVNYTKVNSMDMSGTNKCLYETDKSFDIQHAKASTGTMRGSNDTREYVIERTSKSNTDMGNNLYFYFWRAANVYYGATIKSCELYFTAEGPFQANVAPGSPSMIIKDGVNMVDVPFATSKLDLGLIKPHTKSGVTYFSYDYRNVRELTASNHLYQENAVTTDKKLPATAAAGDIQALRNGGNLYYALGNNTYYIETPTSTKSQEGKDIPLGYRITGARIKYQYGTQAGESSENYADGFYITATRRVFFNTTTYYLQTDGTWNENRPVVWRLTGGNSGKLYSNGKYLYVYHSGRTYYIYAADKPEDGSSFEKEGNNIKYVEDKTSFYIAMPNHNGNAQVQTSGNSFASYSTAQSTAVNPAFTPSPYKLKVYGTDKDNPVQMIDVTEGRYGEINVGDLNNDAVKFEVSGLAAGTKALITFELTLEALDPFVNSIDIICHSLKANGPTLMQQFTSNDFQVSGGKFLFYVPNDFMGDTQRCKFTFENLYSKYGDDTYPNGNARSHARYYFVKSNYYNMFGDGKQYQTSGNEEANDKINAKMCGDQPFKYSNIDELNNNNSGASATTLEEYPYSENLYTSQGGTFTEDIEIAVNNSKKCYLFTGDETRWNIAPTTAMEHRYYAYYLMDIELIVRDYTAKCELTTLYDNTCYNLDGNDTDKPMYGGKFIALDKNTGEKIPTGNAYLTVPMMEQALTDALIEKNRATGQEVLYLDYTDLYSVHIPEKAEMDRMKGLLNPNCLIFFPERSSYNEDNYVQKTRSGDYRACKNIVITDRQPFYSPYKITVPNENYATYKREITIPKNGKVAHASIILPFTLSLENGVHTNATDDACSFKVTKMRSEGCLTLQNPETASARNYYASAKFDPVGGISTQANVPYMVEVLNAPEDEKISFIATQYGSDVMATTETVDDPEYTYPGENATGTIAGTNYNFSNHGSYSGKKINRNEADVFYFSGDMFLSSKNLRPIYPSVYVYPFRAYYLYNSSSQGSKEMIGFDVITDDGDWQTTGITDLAREADLAIQTGKGYITATATKAVGFNIYNANGMKVESVTLNAGESRTMMLPAGLYVVNGTKIIVK